MGVLGRAHLFGVPDLGSICVHDQQLLVAFPRSEADLLHPAAMRWYPPEKSSITGRFGTILSDQEKLN